MSGKMAKYVSILFWCISYIFTFGIPFVFNLSEFGLLCFNCSTLAFCLFRFLILAMRELQSWAQPLDIKRKLRNIKYLSLDPGTRDKMTVILEGSEANEMGSVCPNSLPGSHSGPQMPRGERRSPWPLQHYGKKCRIKMRICLLKEAIAYVRFENYVPCSPGLLIQIKWKDFSMFQYIFVVKIQRELIHLDSKFQSFFGSYCIRTTSCPYKYADLGQRGRSE